MVTAADYQGSDTTWCPGCGNFAILNALKQALAGLDLQPHQVVLYSGVGQAAKLPLYMKCNMLNGLHGRTLTYATASRFVNHEMVTIAVGGGRRRVRRGWQPFSARRASQPERGVPGPQQPGLRADQGTGLTYQ